jgi:hypothetical protein
MNIHLEAANRNTCAELGRAVDLQEVSWSAMCPTQAAPGSWLAYRETESTERSRNVIDNYSTSIFGIR